MQGHLGNFILKKITTSAFLNQIELPCREMPMTVRTEAGAHIFILHLYNKGTKSQSVAGLALITVPQSV